MSYQCSSGLPNPDRVHLSCALCEFMTHHFLQDISRLEFLACPDTSDRRETLPAWHTSLVSAVTVEQLIGKNTLSTSQFPREGVVAGDGPRQTKGGFPLSWKVEEQAEKSV